MRISSALPNGLRSSMPCVCPGTRYPRIAIRLLPATSHVEIHCRAFSSSKAQLSNYWDAMYKREKGKQTSKAPIETYTRMTSVDSAKLSSPPKRARMLVRDFIDDSLYNPHYGYFSKKAYIFSPAENIPFNEIRDSYAFMNYLSKLYKEVEGEYNDVNDIARQVWHTPTELFKPWYGYALAEHMVRQFIKDPKGSDQLIIYEVGAGNGTLMMNILDYLKERYPDIYQHTRYRIIEISPKLAERQSERQDVRQASQRHHCVEIINQSIFTWKEHVPDPCFIIAMEVIDNFSHDLVRYDAETGEARQGIVLCDEDSDYQEAFEPLSDPLIKRYLDLRSKTSYRSPLQHSALRRKLRSLFPFAPNLTGPEFLPTMCLKLFDQLATQFPQHRLILSDFDALPDSVPGLNAPVVQTRYHEMMIPCSTYLVQPGWFDIFFPTNFELMKDIYALVCAEQGRGAQVVTQRKFLEENADIAQTRTKSGENPMLTFYQNFKFLVS